MSAPIHLELTKLEAGNVLVALDEREKYLEEEIAENEACEWLLTVEALKADLAAVRRLIAVLQAA